MKIAAALAAVAALSCGAVFAASAPATTTATPSGASAIPVKHPSLKACNKQADAKNLTGAARSTFVKSCRGGKPHG
ncbi:MAG: PsiF family protein [Steroidobacteraceae bacterium]